MRQYRTPSSFYEHVATNARGLYIWANVGAQSAVVHIVQYGDRLIPRAYAIDAHRYRHVRAGRLHPEMFINAAYRIHDFDMTPLVHIVPRVECVSCVHSVVPYNRFSWLQFRGDGLLIYKICNIVENSMWIYMCSVRRTLTWYVACITDSYIRCSPARPRLWSPERMHLAGLATGRTMDSVDIPRDILRFNAAVIHRYVLNTYIDYDERSIKWALIYAWRLRGMRYKPMMAILQYAGMLPCKN
jgi:hypothetical protein